MIKPLPLYIKSSRRIIKKVSFEVQIFANLQTLDRVKVCNDQCYGDKNEENAYEAPSQT
jgi:hypothetical protein